MEKLTDGKVIPVAKRKQHYKLDLEKRGIVIISADQILGLGLEDGVYADRLDGKFMTKGMTEDELDAILSEFPDDVYQYTTMMEDKLKAFFNKHKINRFKFSDEYPAGYERIGMGARRKGIEPEFYLIRILSGGELTRFIRPGETVFAMKTIEPVWNIVRYKGTLLERFDTGMVVPYVNVDCPFRDTEYVVKAGPFSLEDVYQAIYHERLLAGEEQRSLASRWYVQRIRDRLGFPPRNVNVTSTVKNMGIKTTQCIIDDVPDESLRSKIYEQRIEKVSYIDGLAYKQPAKDKKSPELTHQVGNKMSRFPSERQL